MSTERLDVEDEERRQHRLGELLQRINDSSNKDNRRTACSNNTPFIHQPGPSTTIPSSSLDFGVRQTHAVEPPTELLSRVEAFLPQMEAANAELARRIERSRESVDIETIGENEDEYIEMNLGLGVFDIRRRRQGSDSNSHDTASSSASSSTDESHLVSDSDSDADLSSADDASPSVMPGSGLQTSHQRPIKPLPSRSSPKVNLLDESTNHSPQHPDPENTVQ